MLCCCLHLSDSKVNWLALNLSVAKTVLFVSRESGFALMHSAFALVPFTVLLPCLSNCIIQHQVPFNKSTHIRKFATRRIFVRLT